MLTRGGVDFKLLFAQDKISMATLAFVEQIRYNTRKHEPEDGEMESDATRENRESLIGLNLNQTSTGEDQEQSQNFKLAACEEAKQRRRRPLIRVPVSCCSSRGRRSASILSHPSVISVMLVFYIIISSNLSLNTILKFGSTTSTTRHPHHANELNALNGENGSLLQMAAASPAPAPASARSAATASARMPPVNGSIFGKRSLDNLANKKRKRDEQIASAGQQSTPSPTTTSEPVKYNDIITDLIEEFLYQNNESEPEESTVAFCRMIVYECNQVLQARQRLNKRSSA